MQYYFVTYPHPQNNRSFLYSYLTGHLSAIGKIITYRKLKAMRQKYLPQVEFLVFCRGFPLCSPPL